jgi:staphylococcal nuclease domain-containing protein 1
VPQYTQLILAPGGGAAAAQESTSSPQKKGSAQNVGVPRGAPTTKKQLVERAKAFEEQLKAKRAGHDGIVTFIMNGSRMRLKLVHEKLLITFQMDGVRAPNAERAAGNQALNVPKAEPFGTESLAFCREQCMQQDVKVVVNRVDPSGTFVGQIFVNKGGQRQDLAVMLLEKGLAYCDSWNQNQSYYSSEEKAKKASLAWWSVPHADAGAAEQEAASAAASKAGKPIKGEIYHINSVNSFYMVPTGTDSIKVQNDCQAAGKDSYFKPCDSANNRPRKNRLYVAQYWEDKKFYRAKYEGAAQDPSYQFSMFFIDTGITSDCDVVKEIPTSSDLGNLSKMPACAQHCSLYGIRTTDEFEWEAAEAFFKKTNKKVVSGVTEGVFYDQGTLTQKVTLGLNNGSDNLQLALLKDALVRLTKKEKTPQQFDYKQWSQAETQAKRNHTKLWQYGDVGSDDEDY